MLLVGYIRLTGCYFVLLQCRIVFRTEIENLTGDMEVLQVVSDPISCTQLPGTPEITKMSLSTCSPSGGEELWMIGKNFLKDCVVVFQESSCSRRLPDRCDIVILS